MLNDCTKLIIPVINEIFGKNYKRDAKIVQHANEHFINQKDGQEEKIISDSNISIFSEDGTEDRYIIECESKDDGKILVRILEYGMQVALESANVTDDEIIIKMPRLAVLFLRSTKNTPEIMKATIETPGGSVSFEIPTVKIKNYSLEEFFEKDFYFLIPFYILKREKNLSKCNKNQEELEKLELELLKIRARLDDDFENGKIDSHDRRTILDMGKKIIDHVTRKYEKVFEEVKNIMGGRVLEHEAKRLRNEGISIGRTEGISTGKRMEKFETARRMRTYGANNSMIIQFTGLSDEDLAALDRE